MTLLELRNIRKAFGNVLALDQVNLNLERGEVLGIVGPNGSGKTTLLNVVSGYYKLTKGEIYYKDRIISGMRTDKIARLGIVRTFQSNLVYQGLTVFEHMLGASCLMTQANLWQGFFNTRPYVANIEKITERAMGIINDFGLAAYSDKMAAGLPHGTQRVLGIAMAMAAKPELLLLDEPLAGMDAGETENLSDNIRKIIKMGVTVMMVEHNIKTVIQLCPRVVVLDFGLKIADGKPEEVLNSKEVVEAYLGVD